MESVLAATPQTQTVISAFALILNGRTVLNHTYLRQRAHEPARK